MIQGSKPNVNLCFMAECLAPSCSRYVEINTGSLSAITCGRNDCNHAVSVMDKCDVSRNDPEDKSVWRSEDIGSEYYEEIMSHIKQFGDNDKDDFVVSTFKLKAQALKETVAAVLARAHRIIYDRIKNEAKNKRKRRIECIEKENDRMDRMDSTTFINKIRAL